MSGTIRSRMEAQRDRHAEIVMHPYSGGVVGTGRCSYCQRAWPCPDRVAADDTLTDLNNAGRFGDHEGGRDIRLIPDPDSRDWPMPIPPPYPADDEGEPHPPTTT